jgi:hypothetical protein
MNSYLIFPNKITADERVSQLSSSLGFPIVGQETFTTPVKLTSGTYAIRVDPVFAPKFNRTVVVVDFLLPEEKVAIVTDISDLIAPERVRPTLTITNVTVDSEHSSNFLENLEDGEVTCIKGSTLTATGELRIGTTKISNFTGIFRLPLRQQGGPDRIVLARITNGDLDIQVPCNTSGIFAITEELINEHLIEEQKMNFKDTLIYVIEQ